MIRKIIKVVWVIGAVLGSFYAGKKYGEVKEHKVCEISFREAMQTLKSDVPQDVVYLQGYVMRVKKDGTIEMWEIK